MVIKQTTNATGNIWTNDKMIEQVHMIFDGRIYDLHSPSSTSKTYDMLS